MAKALLGHLNGADPRAMSSLMAENRRLRTRIADLESVVTRLQAENDALAVAAVESSSLLRVPDQMQPA